MKKSKLMILIFFLTMIFSCQREKNPIKPPGGGNIHPQADIPWPSLAKSPWPMHHHDPQSTGRSPYVGPQQGRVAWKYNVGGPVGTSVAIGPDSTIYFATSYDTSEGYQKPFLYALTWNGILKWKFRLSDIPGVNSQGASPLIASDGTIYIGTIDNRLLAINPNGTLKWKFETDGAIYQLGMNIGLDGAIYFVDNTNHLYAVDQSGMLRWKIGENYKFGYSDPSGISFSPDGETLYLGCDGTAESDTIKGLVAVDVTGKVKWLFRTGSITVTPQVDNSGNIFFSAGKGLGSNEENQTGVFSVTSEGQLRWKYLTAYIGGLGATIDYDGNIYALTMPTGTEFLLISFDQDGTIRWKLDISDLGPVVSSLVCDFEGTIYYATRDAVYAISSHGKIRWTIRIGENGWTSPALADHYLFVGTWFHGPGKEFFCIN